MAGRTVSKWVRFVVDDNAGTLREVPVNDISVVGIKYDEQDVTAFQDAVKAALPGQGDAPIEISGPWSTDAAVAASGSGVAPALSGSHTVLQPINGLNVPLSLGVYFGDRTHWATGAPVFGISSSATTGYLCTEFTVNPNDMTYHAKFVVYPGSTPAWGTAAIV